jgi:hypothetical protein
MTPINTGFTPTAGRAALCVVVGLSESLVDVPEVAAEGVVTVMVVPLPESMSWADVKSALEYSPMCSKAESGRCGGRTVGDVELRRLRQNGVDVVCIFHQIDLEPAAERPSGTGRVYSQGAGCAVDQRREELAFSRQDRGVLTPVTSAKPTTQAPGGETDIHLVDQDRGEVDRVCINTSPTESLRARIGPPLDLVGHGHGVSQDLSDEGDDKRS